MIECMLFERYGIATPGFHRAMSTAEARTRKFTPERTIWISTQWAGKTYFESAIRTVRTELHGTHAEK